MSADASCNAHLFMPISKREFVAGIEKYRRQPVAVALRVPLETVGIKMLAGAEDPK